MMTKVGMKIEVVGSSIPVSVPNGSIMTIVGEYGNGDVDATLDGGDGFKWLMYDREFRVIEDAPKTWGEMTDEERKDVSLGAMNGESIELGGGSFGWVAWDGTTPLSMTHQRIRIKPEPTRETVFICVASTSDGRWYQPGNPGSLSTHRITFDTLNGEPITGTFTNENGDVITLEEV